MWFFKRKTKTVDKPFAPSVNFNFSLLNLIQNGVQKVWAQTVEIDEISDEISRLMSIRQGLVQNREDLVTTLNTHRKVIGMSEIDEEGITVDDVTDSTVEN